MGNEIISYMRIGSEMFKRIAEISAPLAIFCGSVIESGEKLILRGRESRLLSRFCTSQERRTGGNRETGIFTLGCKPVITGLKANYLERERLEVRVTGKPDCWRVAKQNLPNGTK
ncbi:hypothetical protein [Pseudomonas atacamensis]|uniref:hypothetical protein n=1 Tax=Pseudomonas atacamensis TaxID=2565368 RepID=UPI0024923143|nr:hypothetical protein [Pseudomonas atacamensis]